MENDFINSLYKEEERIFNKIISNPLYTELIEIQRFIIKKGGNPRQEFGIKSLTNQESLFTSFIYSPEKNLDKYDKKWVWSKKIEYTFSLLGGKGSPKEIIDFLTILEGFDNNDKKEKEKIGGNVYNVLSKLRVEGNLIKDETIQDKLIYILINEESQLKDIDS